MENCLNCNNTFDLGNRKLYLEFCSIRCFRSYRSKSNERKQLLRKQTLRDRFSILIKYKFTCQYCGRKAPDVILEIDHIIPLSKKGSNKIDNLTLACRECNIGKSNIYGITP